MVNFVHNQTKSVIKCAGMLGVRTSYITLRGAWYKGIIQSMLAPTEDKRTKKIYDELENVME